MPISKKKSLILLKENALKAAFNVPMRDTQKLISRNDVRPINSHPKNNIIKLLAETNTNMLIINDAKNNKKRSTKGSYLK
jgi:phage terminase large subunit